MNRTILGLLAATALTAAIPAVASAQTINERQASLFARIDAGITSGQLTRSEANSLRTDFYSLSRLETDYRNSRPGLTDAERADLNRRFDTLSARIRVNRSDNDRYANWQPINQRQDNLFRQIDTGVRNGGLTRREADQLRSDFNAIVLLEADYRRSGGGFTVAERQDLDRRLDILAQRINMERRDGDQRGNDGNWARNITQKIATLNEQIERSIRNGWLGRTDARNIRASQQELARTEANYRRTGGLSNQEARDLSMRADRLQAVLERETGRDFGWGYGAGYNQSYYR